MKILIVDDDADDIYFFCEAAAEIDQSMTVVKAGNGLDAINYLLGEVHAPDLIFLDVNMPLLNGLDTLRAIRSIKAFEKSYVVVMTTSKHQKEAEEAIKLGAFFETKPVCYQGLVKLLKQHLKTV